MTTRSPKRVEIEIPEDAPITGADEDWLYEDLMGYPMPEDRRDTIWRAPITHIRAKIHWKDGSEDYYQFGAFGWLKLTEDEWNGLRKSPESG